MPVAKMGDGSIWEQSQVGSLCAWLLRDVRTGKVWAAAWPLKGGWYDFKWEAFGVTRKGMTFVQGGLGHLFDELETALTRSGAPLLHPIRRPAQ